MPDTIPHTRGQFDFEHWSHLASEDPEAFEARRQALIEDLINSANRACAACNGGWTWCASVPAPRWRPASA